MPITFTVTCDTEAELVRFFENLSFANGMGSQSLKAATTAPARKQKPGPKPKNTPTPKKKASKSAPASTVRAKSPKAGKLSKSGKTTTGNGRKPATLAPLIQDAIQEMVKRGKPFRSREVTRLVLKKTPGLNESSVTTGVSKKLSESDLKWEQIKDAIGRPYKLYKP